MQQAAGRANREGRRAEPGRVVVFDASDAPVPRFYRAAVGSTQCYFGPDRDDPDSVTALDHYYRHLYSSLDADHGQRGMTIQERRTNLDFLYHLTRSTFQTARHLGAAVSPTHDGPMII